MASVKLILGISLDRTLHDYPRWRHCGTLAHATD
jgi:hypothetical protein